MKKIIKISTAIFILLIASLSFAMTGDQAANKFRQHLTEIGKMSGIISISSGTGLMYTGVFKYAKPGKIYMKFSNPTGRTLVTNGRKLWVMNAGSKVCGIQDLTETSLSGGIAYMTKDYLAIVTSQRGNGCTIKLKNDDKIYPEIILFLDKNFFPKKAILKDRKGEKISFSISKVNYKPDFIDSIFEYSIPANTHVVKNPLNIK